MYLRRLPKFEYLAPKTVEEACSLLQEHRGKAKVMAGGTDLLPKMKQRRIVPQYLIGLRGIPDLDDIVYSEAEGLRIGALATHRSIVDSPVINEKFGLLATACHKVGTPQIRNMGTIGGNICNAGPSQDAIPPLLALDAKLKLVGLQGERIIPLEDFLTGPFETVLDEAELLTEVQVPTPPPRSAGCYQWLTKITTGDETLVGVAALVVLDSGGGVLSDIRIALCSVAPTPIRARRAEDVLRGKRIEGGLVEEAAQVAAAETMPRSRADYRRKMTTVLVKRAINEVLQKIR